MAQPVDLTCPTCGHTWQVDLDKHQAKDIVYREDGQGKATRTRIDTYHFRCPKDGTLVVIDVRREV